MKRQMLKLILAAVLCALLAVPVFAAEQGSLLLKDVEAPVVVFRAADASGVPVADFAGTVEKLTAEDLKPEIAKKLYKQVQDKALSGQTGTPNADKEVFFASLDKGWYLVCSAGEKAEFAPFLICVPMTIGDKTVYDIQAEPKIDSPLDPGPTDPIIPEPDIPQTGAIQWPKYLLLILGGLAIGAGVFEVLRGREKSHE